MPELSDRALTVLASLINRTPDSPQGKHKQLEVSNECPLSGIDFNLGLRELTEFKVGEYGLIFLDRNDAIGINPGGWEIAKANEEKLKKLLEADDESF